MKILKNGFFGAFVRNEQKNVRNEQKKLKKSLIVSLPFFSIVRNELKKFIFELTPSC
jgi:hypothetical protein